MSARKAGNTVMVLMKSLASEYTMVGFRPKTSSSRKEMIAFDPNVNQNVLFREARKIRTLKKWTPS